MTAATLLTGESRGEILEENFENEKPEADDFFEINLSPNPARDAVQILFSENFPFDSAHGTLEITDLNGKILQSISMENLIENGGWIVLKNFPKGISIVSVRPENGMPMTRKLVVD